MDHHQHLQHLQQSSWPPNQWHPMMQAVSPAYAHTCYTPAATVFYTPVYDHTPSTSGLQDSGYISNPSSTPLQTKPSSRQYTSPYGTTIHYSTTPKNRIKRPADKNCSSFQLTNPDGAIEYRFSGENLAQLPRGAFIEMSSPDAQVLTTPRHLAKRRRLCDQNGGDSMYKCLVEKRTAQRGLDLDRLPDKENHLPDSQSQPAMFFSESINARTDFIGIPIIQHTLSTPMMPASAPPPMPTPDLMTSPVRQPSTSKANVTRTPTPFKKAMLDVTRKRGKLLDFNLEATPMHQVAQDLKEILQSDDLDETIDYKSSPSKYIGNDLMLGGEYLSTTNVSPNYALQMTTFDQVTPSFSSNAVLAPSSHPFDVAPIQLPATADIPDVQPPLLSARWLTIAFGRTSIQLDLVAKARRLIKAYRRRKKVIVRLDDEIL